MTDGGVDIRRMGRVVMIVSGVKRSGALIGVGAAVGAALIVYGVHSLSATKRRVLPPPVEQARVVTAVRAIARGDRIGPDDIAVTVLAGRPPADALTAAGSAIGRVAVADIPVHHVVTGSELTSTASLAAQVPIGYRAISITTNDEIAVSDLLRPGDIVDVDLVLGDAVLSKGAGAAAPDRSESSTLLQAVQVVSVGDLIGPAQTASSGRADRRDPPRRTLTLAMTPEQVAQFTLARSLGAFYLALRNPGDHAGPPRALARLSDIRLGAPEPVRATPVRLPRPEARAPAKPDGVELVVGGQSQTIYPQ